VEHDRADPDPPADALGALRAVGYEAPDGGARVTVYVFDGQDSLDAGAAELQSRDAGGARTLLGQNGALLFYGTAPDGAGGPLSALARAFAGDE